MILYGPFAPDAGELAPGALMVADGVLPKADGYGPAPQLVTPGNADALAASPRGSQTCIKRDGTSVVFFLTATKLYQLETDNSWTEIASGYNCTSGDDWSTVQFGDKLLFTNTTDGLKAYDIEAGGSPSAITAAGDPREIFVCGNTVFALDCKDDAGDRDNRLMRNSAAGDHTNWTSLEADTQPLDYGGELICGRNLAHNMALVFQRQAIRRLHFGEAGGGAFYALQEVSTETGAVGAKSVVVGDGVVFGLSSRGFFRVGLAGGPEMIGAGLIDNWFLDRVALDDLVKVQGAIDPSRKVALWRYPMDADASATVTEHVIGYSWEFKQRPWFTMTVNLAYLSRIATPGYTLTSWEAAFTDLAGSPDIPIGDRFWQGGKQQILAALDSTLKYATFSGTPQVATIETGVSNSPVTGLIGWATPIDNAANGQLSLGVKDALDDATTWKTAATKTSNGRVPLRGRGKNIAFRYTIAAGETWTNAKGIDHVVAATGGPR